MTILLSNYKKSGKLPSSDAVYQAYQLSGLKSNIRTYMARTIAYSITVGTNSAWSTDGLAGSLMLSAELTYDVVELLRSSRGNLQHPHETEKCKLHVHSDPNLTCPYKAEIL